MTSSAPSTRAPAESAVRVPAARAEIDIRLANAHSVVPKSPPGPGVLTLMIDDRGEPEARISVGGVVTRVDAAVLGLASACTFESVRGWTHVCAGSGLNFLFDRIGKMRYARLAALGSAGPGRWGIVAGRLESEGLTGQPA